MSWTSLSGVWTATQLSKLNIQEPFEVSIPGSVHLGLLGQNLIPDPIQGTNELEVLWIGRSDFELSSPIPRLPDRKYHILRCSGVDTHAEIYLGDKSLGFISSEFIYTDFELPSNESQLGNLKVILHSPIEYCTKKSQDYTQKYGYSIPSSYYVNGTPNFNFIRKTACSFAWDWGPSVPTLGIGDIGIFSFDHGYIYDLKCLVKPTNEQTKFLVEVSVYLSWRSSSSPTLSLELVTIDTNGSILTSLVKHRGPWTPDFMTQFEVDVEPWQIFSYPTEGQNTLYKVLITLEEEFQTVGRVVGFRKVELIRQPDSGDTVPPGLPMGESFYIQVNNMPVFAKGSNYIPQDVLFRGSGVRKTLDLLKSCVREAGMNCLRIWGGGRYESEEFYLECDRLGILLWHDMMFACSLYPSDTEFLELAALEVKQQLRRLAGHPCIAIWAGNNENEELLQSIIAERPNDKDRLLSDYQKLYIDTILPIYEEEMRFKTILHGNTESSRTDTLGDCVVPFWPSSPSNGIQAWGVPGDPKQGDIHYWGVWHGNKPFEAYETIFPRFCSEFGFQSAPNFSELVTWIGQVDLTNDPNIEELEIFNWTSREIEFRQRSPARGNLGLISQMMLHLKLPRDFKRQLWATQLLQGLAMQKGIQSWRRLQPYCMGTLYWQLNDIWAGMSWSTINFSGVWKLSHYFVKRAFTPLQLSFKFMPSPTAPAPTPSTEIAPFYGDDTLELWLTVDPGVLEKQQNEHFMLSVKWWSLSNSRFPLEVESLVIDYTGIHSRVVWSRKGLSQYEKTTLMVNAELKAIDPNSTTLAQSDHFFVPLKRIPLQRPRKLDITIDRIMISENGVERRIYVSLKSDSFALFVTLPELSTSAQGAWSDNGFILYPHETRTVSCRLSPDSVNPEHLSKFIPEDILNHIKKELIHVYSSYN